MNSSFARSLLAGAIILTVASPVWAAGATKGASAKEPKMERKAVANGTEEIKKLQNALKAKGQDPGAVDGIMGEKTRAALKAFQEASGLKVTGKLDDQTAQKLGVEKHETLANKETKKETK
jgi:peptidoglycan hydrolase-like protein with peptidoglycan-binding domain